MLSYGDKYAHNAWVFLHGHSQHASDMRAKMQSLLSIGDLEEASLVIFFPSTPNRTWFAYVDEHTHDYRRHSLRATRTYLHAILRVMHKRYRRVILGGYSQGGGMAVDAALTFSGAVFPALSICYFALTPSATAPGETYTTDRQHRLYFANARDDPIVALDAVGPSLQALRRRHSVVRYEFDGSHWDFWGHRGLRDFVRSYLRSSLE